MCEHTTCIFLQTGWRNVKDHCLTLLFSCPDSWLCPINSSPMSWQEYPWEAQTPPGGHCPLLEHGCYWASVPEEEGVLGCLWNAVPRPHPRASAVVPAMGHKSDEFFSPSILYLPPCSLWESAGLLPHWHPPTSPQLSWAVILDPATGNHPSCHPGWSQPRLMDPQDRRMCNWENAGATCG